MSKKKFLNEITPETTPYRGLPTILAAPPIALFDPSGANSATIRSKALQSAASSTHASTPLLVAEFFAGLLSFINGLNITLNPPIFYEHFLKRPNLTVGLSTKDIFGYIFPNKTRINTQLVAELLEALTKTEVSISSESLRARVQSLSRYIIDPVLAGVVLPLIMDLMKQSDKGDTISLRCVEAFDYHKGEEDIPNGFSVTFPQIIAVAALENWLDPLPNWYHYIDHKHAVVRNLVWNLSQRLGPDTSRWTVDVERIPSLVGLSADDPLFQRQIKQYSAPMRLNKTTFISIIKENGRTYSVRLTNKN